TNADNEVDNGIVHAVDAVIGLPDVTTFATADPSFSILVQALTREDDYNYVAADGTGILQTSGESPAPFTVFAPTDDAFVALLDELGMNELGDIPADLLAKVLNYHVVTDANVVAGDLTDEMEVTTFESGTFTIYLGENVTIVDENNRTTTIIVTDVQATNGVIHAIDRVLLPEDDAFTPDNSIADFTANAESYSSLFAALRAANLFSLLDGDDEYTVFAPDNDAFDAFLSDMAFASLDEVPVDVLEQNLLNHVQAGSITAGDLATGYYTSSSTAGHDGENLSLFINTDGGVTLNGVSTVTTADVMVDNGVIHAVDAVIGLPDITTFALADPTFSTLVDALTREDSYTFVEILQSSDENSPFTVFAPTNAAFGQLLTDLSLNALADLDADVLAEVLSYHVITGANATASTLTDGMMITTFQGEDVTINVGDNVTVTDVSGGVATVVLADVQATNGVIHAIDMVLLPTLDD
ncbi:MAG: fasciclin domain-containing protein, partial [Gramella sp.]|nr:fasciclin domain-containing protein [Christiangramia sp.]